MYPAGARTLALTATVQEAHQVALHLICLSFDATVPGLDPAVVRFVPHHIAHAASTALAAPFPDSAVLVCDGRGEARSHWAGTSRGGELAELAAQPLPDCAGTA